MKLLLCILMTCLLSGCLIPAEMKSATSPEYSGPPHKIFIAASFGNSFSPMSHSINNMSGKDMVESLESCGIAAEFAPLDDLIGQNAAKEELQQYSPDALLTIQWTQDVTVRYGATSDITYIIELTDMLRHTVVWKSTLKFSPLDRGPASLSNDIIHQMKTDKIIPDSCVEKPFNPIWML